ncbi:phage tail tip fiber protein, partial [Proteus mirabilis]|nr:DUF3672 domain-containing protein [Proteus mirabilis]
GQFFIREAFLDKANVREMVLSEAIKSKNYELGKDGFNIDANTGNAEFNNATFRGTIDGADGNFKGTVYAERLIGDVSTSYVIKGSESEGTYGSYQTQVTSSKVIYAGGMPYDVMITIPLVIVMGEATDLSSVMVSIVVDGEKKYLDVANIAGQAKGLHKYTYSHSFSQYSFKIPAGRKNVEIIINGETTGKGYVHVKLFDCLITASKSNSSSFRNS